MAKYKVLETSFIGNAIVDAGAIIELELPEGVEPGENVELVDPLDHDGNGKKGGSKPKPATDAE
ncbi:MAG: hypothetical protein ACKO01_08435 [Erythrobacter sp.]